MLEKEPYCVFYATKFFRGKDDLKLTTGLQKTYGSQNKRNRKTKKTFDLKERTLDALELWKMLMNPFVLELTF